jgi:hypothetical protein
MKIELRRKEKLVKFYRSETWGTIERNDSKCEIVEITASRIVVFSNGILVCSRCVIKFIFLLSLKNFRIISPAWFTLQSTAVTTCAVCLNTKNLVICFQSVDLFIYFVSSSFNSYYILKQYYPIGLCEVYFAG